MKRLFFAAGILVAILASCRKDPLQATHGWRLVRMTGNIVGWNIDLTPAPDSSVLLIFPSYGRYISEMNGVVVSQGNCSIDEPLGIPQDSILTLYSFHTTGILAPTGALGGSPEDSLFGGLSMHSSNDTLTLSSPDTPGGNVVYTFVAQN